ncbi:TonB-dependent receptor [candidate division KSB1 bacterium]|nr:TonB-dependent receptor [candidate division KSB1 bacterium]
MKKTHVALLTVLLFCFSKTVLAQSTGTLQGEVTDNATGEALPGVNVTVSGTVLGAATDADGRFSIERVPTGTHNILITMIGYKRAEVTARIEAEQVAAIKIALEETILETPEVMVTANKRRQSIQDTPNSVGVMTSREIEQKNQVYIDQFLQQASGVNFVGNQVNIRGSSGFSYGAGSRVLFLIDGVPVMPGDSGDIKWDMIPAAQIERVEIIKGAGSALYGSSALGGVINIITKKAVARPVTNLRLSTGAYDEPAHPEWKWSDELRHFNDIDIDHTRKIGQKSEILAAVGRHQSMGYRENTEQLRHNVSFKWNYKPTGTHNLTLSTNWEGGDRQTGLMWRSQRQALQVAPEALGDYVHSNKFGINLFHNWVLRKNLGLQTRVSYFYNYWKNWFHDNISASEAQKPGVEIQGDWQISANNSLIFGAEGSWDKVISDLVGTHDQYVVGAYVQNERALITNVNLTLGMRYDYAWVDIGFIDSEFNPKIGLIWHAHSKFRVRASSGRGFRAPSMSERFADSIYSGLRIIPNPELKSETSWSQEIGINFTPSSLFYIDIAGFMNDYWDLIEPEPNENQVVQFINITRARITGVETTVKMMPFTNLSFDLGYTWMDPQDMDLDVTLAYRPRHLFTGGVTYSLGAFECGADMRYISRFDAVKVYPFDDRVDQKLINLRAVYRIGSSSVTLSVNNVFNHNHTQMERTLMPIRHFVLTLSSRF